MSRIVSITWEVMVVALTVGYTTGRREGNPMSPHTSVSTAQPFGALLGQWRMARKMSQFALALSRWNLLRSNQGANRVFPLFLDL